MSVYFCIANRIRYNGFKRMINGENVLGNRRCSQVKCIPCKPACWQKICGAVIAIYVSLITRLYNRPTMKYLISLFCISSLLLLSNCHSSTPRPDFKPGQGVEIYLASHVNSFNPDIDYSKISIDTVQLQAQPFLAYNQIKSYHRANHTFVLTIPVSRLTGYQPRVNGHMFVVTIDKQPVYCGFVQPAISSFYVPWVMISDPMMAQPAETVLKIYFNSPVQEKDPRNHQILTQRLQQDGKLN